MPNLFPFPVLSPVDLDAEGFPVEVLGDDVLDLLDALEVAA